MSNPESIKSKGQRSKNSKLNYEPLTLDPSQPLTPIKKQKSQYNNTNDLRIVSNIIPDPNLEVQD